MTTTYKFTGDAYLMGIKLNDEPIVYEVEKDEVVTLDRALQNTIFAVKKMFKTYTSFLDLVERRSFVILDGQFDYFEYTFDAFELQIPTTIHKMAEKIKDDKYRFLTYPMTIQQLYFMKAIGKKTFTTAEFKKAFMEDHKLGLFYNNFMVDYNVFHVNKKNGRLTNENYPNRWFTYDVEKQYYKMFDNILQIKKIK